LSEADVAAVNCYCFDGMPSSQSIPDVHFDTISIQVNSTKGPRVSIHDAVIAVTRKSGGLQRLLRQIPSNDVGFFQHHRYHALDRKRLDGVV